jgi:adenosine kinase
LAWNLSMQRSAELGCLLATYVLETVGTQEYRFDRTGFVGRFAQAYGSDAAEQLAQHLVHVT